MVFLYDAWVFQYSVIPCLIAYLIFDIPIIVRRLTRRVYAPIYFSFVPFGFADEMYARYFGEDFFGKFSGDPGLQSKSYLRVKIVIVSIFSLLLTIFLSPFVAAVFCHFFLTSQQVTEFIWTLTLVKMVLLTKSLFDLRYVYRVTDKLSVKLIFCIYCLYLFFIVYNFWLFEGWLSDNYDPDQPFAIITTAVDFVVVDLLYGVILFGFLGWFVSWLITSREGESVGNDTG